MCVCECMCVIFFLSHDNSKRVAPIAPKFGTNILIYFLEKLNDFGENLSRIVVFPNLDKSPDSLLFKQQSELTIRTLLKAQIKDF